MAFAGPESIVNPIKKPYFKHGYKTSRGLYTASKQLVSCLYGLKIPGEWGKRERRLI